MKAFAADNKKFEAAGARILGVSRDDVDTQRKFRLHCVAPFPLLSDTGGKVCAAYGIAMPVVKLPKRTTFLIDGQGIIREIVPGMPDNAALLASLAAWDESPGVTPEAGKTPALPGYGNETSD